MELLDQGTLDQELLNAMDLYGVLESFCKHNNTPANYARNRAMFGKIHLSSQMTSQDMFNVRSSFNCVPNDFIVYRPQPGSFWRAVSLFSR
jgi:hypothetical protein